MNPPPDGLVKRGAPAEKVTVFVMGQRDGVDELLLLYHPHAGIQLPAGTMEDGESAMDAALREGEEETGLQGLVWGELLGKERVELASDKGFMAFSTPVMIRPDGATRSYVAGMLRRGIFVDVLRAEGEFLQVRYAEFDRFPDPQYVTFELVGWVPATAVTGTLVRNFVRLVAPDATPPSWTTVDDEHHFTLRWHALDALPALVPPQAPWLKYLPAR
jgi:8-oxo-dGTP pyrophosphatase MutT (NUDIX family)